MNRPWERALDEQVHLIRWLETSVGTGYTKTVSPNEGLTNATELRSALNRAETFWVSFDLYRLTLHAAGKLRGRTIRDTVPPARDGFVLLDRPPGLSREENQTYFTSYRDGSMDHEAKLEVAEGLRRIYQAFSWHIVPEGVSVAAYAFIEVRDGGKRGWAVTFPSEDSGYPRHLAPTGFNANFPIDAECDHDLFRFLVAFWLLTAQRLVRQTPTPLERHARRRAERANLSLEDGIKVVTLRREEARPALAAADGAEVNWSHRWIVSEHTRNQWYPTLAMHLPITIEAYEKGPEGAPLVIKDRIYKVDR